MAAPGRAFINSLYRYGKESSEDRAQLVKWRKAALESIAEGNGGDLASGSGNGMAFTKSMGGMSNAEWFTALDQAIQLIDAGIPLPSSTLGRIV